MLIVLGVLAALLAAAWLLRGASRAWQRGERGTLLAVAAALGALALAALAATGRMHWLGALAAAFIPFLRRIGSLLRLLPLVSSVLKGARAGSSAGHRQTPRPPKGGMTRAEAFGVLGLAEGASEREIMESHRRLMQRVHPDRGGSAFLAQQLNEARRVLLDKGKA